MKTLATDITKAFPYEESYNHAGMDLRDYFAAKAMQALVSVDLSSIQIKYDLKRSEIISTLAYSFADAMMEARK